ncbi:MAG: hypothetical protein LBP35_03390 [Candidatus Ancillula trichonymphae]|nr:hypothetical protein [Candidatus Ancillula trichonymphae]
MEPLAGHNGCEILDQNKTARVALRCPHAVEGIDNLHITKVASMSSAVYMLDNSGLVVKLDGIDISKNAAKGYVELSVYDAIGIFASCSNFWVLRSQQEEVVIQNKRTTARKVYAFGSNQGVREDSLEYMASSDWTTLTRTTTCRRWWAKFWIKCMGELLKLSHHLVSHLRSRVTELSGLWVLREYFSR